MKLKLTPLYLILLFFLFAIFSCNKKPDLIDQDLFGIYPNPCIDFFNIQINTAGESETSLSVFGTKGELLLKREFEIGDDGSIFIDVSEEEEGAIHVLVERGNEKYREQVIKIK